MGNLKINDLEGYQTEDIDSQKVQGGFTYPFHHYNDFTFTIYPVPLTFGMEGIYYSESTPVNYELTISNQEGNSLAGVTIGKTGNSHYATSVSMSGVY